MNFAQRAALLSLVMALASVRAVAQEALTTDQMVRQETMMVYKECLWAGAEKLDDGISDAASIGAAVAPQCRVQLKMMVDVFTLGEPPEVSRLTYDKMVAAEVQTATAAVLEVRRSSNTAKK